MVLQARLDQLGQLALLDREERQEIQETPGKEEQQAQLGRMN
jgi:hypothetical protein